MKTESSSSMKLYFNPRSRAVISQWLLNEAGVNYELAPISFEAGEHRSPAFLAINPAGKLPALVDGHAAVFESVAIGLYIADRYPQAKLAPAPDDPRRGRYLSLMVYTTSQLEPAIGDALLGVTRHRSRGWSSFEDAAAMLAASLESRPGPYLLGEQFTAVDVLIGAQLLWCGLPLPRALQDYTARLLERPHAAALRR